MNYVDFYDILDTETKQIPCITGEGAPNENTEGAVGCFYMDTLTGDTYKHTVDGWQTMESGHIDSDAKFVTEDSLAYDKIIHSQAEWDEMISDDDSWNGAINILLMCDVITEIGSSGAVEPLWIPSNVVSINGNGHKMEVRHTELLAQAGHHDLIETCLRNFNPIDITHGGLYDINGIYNCVIKSVDGTICRCKNLIGNTFYEQILCTIEDCNTIVLDAFALTRFGKNGTDLVFKNCTNVIYEKTQLSEFTNNVGFVTEKVLQDCVDEKIAELNKEGIILPDSFVLDDIFTE